MVVPFDTSSDTDIIADMAIGSRSNLSSIPGPKPYQFQPGNCANPLGRPNVPDKLTLRSLLGKHLDGIVRHKIPDAMGNEQVVEINRMELLVRLMVQTVFKPRDEDHPGFRQECLKQILCRIDPVKANEANGTGQPIVIVVRSEPEMRFAEQLQQTAEAGTLAAPAVIDALLSAPCDIDFNGVSDDNGGNGNTPPQLPADDPAGD